MSNRDITSQSTDLVSLVLLSQFLLFICLCQSL